MDQESSQRKRSGGSALSEKRLELFYWVGALILTLGVRLYLFWQYYTINNDGVLYIEAARRFWEGQWGEGLASFYPPLFPLMIAVAYPLTGDWELAGQFWPFLLGVLMLFPLFVLLRGVYGQRVAKTALFFYGVSPYLARLSLHVRSEIPYIFFLVLALYLLQRGLARGKLVSFFLMGVCAAISYLIRPEGIGLILVAGCFFFYRGWKADEKRRALLALTLLFLGFILLSLPYILYLRWDTGSWIISRKTGLIVSMGLAEHDPAGEPFALKDTGEISLARLIASHPFFYAKKVFVDSFRSVGVYFEALHYSYLPFLLLGWFFFFRSRFWEKGDLVFFLCVVFYLMIFALLHVNRRNAIPLIPISLGWISMGYLALNDYLRAKWKKGSLAMGIVLVSFLAGTLPKTLQAIGQEKFYLREAGRYLKEKPGNPIIITNNARVAFYAQDNNQVILKDLGGPSVPPTILESDYLALDLETYVRAESLLKQQGWSLDKKFSAGPRETLYVLRRATSR